MQGHCWDQGAFLLGVDDPRQGKPWSEQGRHVMQYNLELEGPVSCLLSLVTLHRFLILYSNLALGAVLGKTLWEK